jgi:hypothetical protein
MFRAMLSKLKDGSVEFGGGYGWEPAMRLLLKVDRTSNDFADQLRHALSFTGLPRAELEAALPAIVMPGPVELGLGGNYSGEVMLQLESPVYQNALRLMATLRNRASLVLTKLALRRYHDEHGVLPATLEELVPGYLDSVPLDWMDGAPVRYDPARGMIWSVGKDFRDGGGDPSVKGDICLELGWVNAGAPGG